MDHESFMRTAIALAEENVASGGGPFGAVVVQSGRIVGRGANSVTRSNDPTAHAEVVAIRHACATLGAFSLRGCSIYTSCEPCPMCLAAIYRARLDCIPLRQHQGRRGRDRIRRRPHLPGDIEAARRMGRACPTDAGRGSDQRVPGLVRLGDQGSVLTCSAPGCGREEPEERGSPGDQPCNPGRRTDPARPLPDPAGTSSRRTCLSARAASGRFGHAGPRE